MSADRDDASDLPTMRAQIEHLTVGECFARAVRFDGNEDGLKDRTHETIRAMRSTIQPSVYRVHKDTHREFTIEQVEGRTATRDILVVIVVTRVS